MTEFVSVQSFIKVQLIMQIFNAGTSKNLMSEVECSMFDVCVNRKRSKKIYA